VRKEIQRGNADRCAVTRPRTPHRAAPHRTAWRAWAVRQKAPGRIRLLCLRLPSGVARFSGRWYYCWRYLSAGTATPRRRRRSSGSGAKRAKGSDAVRRRPSAMCDAPPVLAQSLGTISSSLHTEARRPRRRSAGGRHTAVAVTAHGSAAEVALPVHPISHGCFGRTFLHGHSANGTLAGQSRLSAVPFLRKTCTSGYPGGFVRGHS
jgi:hypothetical protein